MHRILLLFPLFVTIVSEREGEKEGRRTVQVNPPSVIRWCTAAGKRAWLDSELPCHFYVYHICFVMSRGFGGRGKFIFKWGVLGCVGWVVGIILVSVISVVCNFSV